ncbi:hypothetical protein D3C72_307360 [compost metagenome]
MIQVIFDLGQMGLQEIQALLGFFGLTHHVLLQIILTDVIEHGANAPLVILTDVIEHGANAPLVFPFKGKGDNPGILALLADLKIPLQLAYHIQQRLLD